MRREFFDRLAWHKDRVLLDDLVFRLEHYRSDDWELGERCFAFYKIKELIDQYERYWALREDFHPRSILELGMWDGGSVAFWNELFGPQKLVGIDIEERSDSQYFEQFIRSRGLGERVKTFWGVDQADAHALRAIMAAEFSDALDLVVDDASHMYEHTKASFHVIFPLLRPGGLYIIEDWAWAHWNAFQDPDHGWAHDEALTTLIVELIEAVGSSTTLIASATIFQGFAVIERGSTQFERPDEFTLSDHITRRPEPSVSVRRKSRVLRRLARVRPRGWRRQ